MFFQKSKAFLFPQRNMLPPETIERIKQAGGKVTLNSFAFAFPREGVKPTEPTYLIYAHAPQGFARVQNDGRLAAIKFALLNPEKHATIKKALKKGGLQSVLQLMNAAEKGTVPIYPIVSENMVVIPIEARRVRDLGHLGSTLKMLEKSFGLRIKALTRVEDFPSRGEKIQIAQEVGTKDPFFEEVPVNREPPTHSDQFLVRVSLPVKTHQEGIGILRNATQGQLGFHFKEDVFDLTKLPGFERVKKKRPR